MAIDLGQAGIISGLIALALGLVEVLKSFISKHFQNNDEERVTDETYSVQRMSARVNTHSSRLEGHSERLNRIGISLDSLKEWARTRGYQGE